MTNNKDAQITVLPEEEKDTRLRGHESMSVIVWRRFRKHPGAVAGAIVLTLLVVAILLAPLSPYDPEPSSLSEKLQPPSWQHPFGTDSLGRDMLTRVLYGGRISLFVGFMATLIAMVIGVPTGAIAGYFGGWVDNLLMRIIDATLALPSLMILILLTAFLREVQIPIIEKNNVLTIAIVIGLLSWMTIARLVRAIFLSLREMEYVKAARALGSSNFRTIVAEILPNGLGPVIVEATLELGWAIMEESGLSFLGFGIRQPTPSWGNLLSDAQENLQQYPWLAIFPGIMIFLTIISVNYIGDGLRDALDPYKVLDKIEE
ncbi:MAG TPA: ABC transporter permease [Anaerolineales bacterium]|jgi:peptide/nickel transport system permease protein|nr:ABC transporter permease [Anaerolineales bacterium]